MCCTDYHLCCMSRSTFLTPRQSPFLSLLHKINIFLFTSVSVSLCMIKIFYYDDRRMWEKRKISHLLFHFLFVNINWKKSRRLPLIPITLPNWPRYSRTPRESFKMIQDSREKWWRNETSSSFVFVTWLDHSQISCWTKKLRVFTSEWGLRFMYANFKFVKVSKIFTLNYKWLFGNFLIFFLSYAHFISICCNIIGAIKIH